MDTYMLYRFRKSHRNYPDDFVQIHSNNNAAWLVMIRELDDPEIERYDLELVGEGFSYEDCEQVIFNRMKQKEETR